MTTTPLCAVHQRFFQIEMVENEKDCQSEFEDDNIDCCALLLVDQVYLGYNQVCFLDSGFRCIPNLPELKMKGVFGATVFKKKSVGWSQSLMLPSYLQGIK